MTPMMTLQIYLTRQGLTTEGYPLKHYLNLYLLIQGMMMRKTLLQAEVYLHTRVYFTILTALHCILRAEKHSCQKWGLRL